MGLKSAATDAGMKRLFRRLAVAFLLIVVLPGAQSLAQTRPERIVSINACTDQLLFALADRDQIAALTHYAVRDDFSIFTDEIAASDIPLIKGSAEEVLKLKPDLVLAGTYTRRATRQLLQDNGVRLELFPPVSSISDGIEAIRKAAGLFGQEARGESLVAKVEAGLAEAVNKQSRDVSVLQLQRRGFVSGPETLIGDLLNQLGVRNAAAQLGIDRIGRTSLEAALKSDADALVLFDPYSRPGDQGAALLHHPALIDAYPPQRRLVLPGRLVICAGPALPLAISHLSDGLERLSGNVSRR